MDGFESVTDGHLITKVGGIHKGRIRRKLIMRNTWSLFCLLVKKYFIDLNNHIIYVCSSRMYSLYTIAPKKKKLQFIPSTMDIHTTIKCHHRRFEAKIFVKSPGFFLLYSSSFLFLIHLCLHDKLRALGVSRSLGGTAARSTSAENAANLLSISAAVDNVSVGEASSPQHDTTEVGVVLDSGNNVGQLRGEA